MAAPHLLPLSCSNASSSPAGPDYGLDIAQIARLLVGFEYRANGEQFVCAPEYASQTHRFT
ncbi:hypothetical protein CUJ88_44025 (plasmid) [Paraburkholderia hospita]|nr:hypothetical protein CUJ88_44025 [Paraburkholderia hospita]